MNCREIELDAARTHGFIQRVRTESEFSGKDVLAILGDFGIGNAMERSAAMESATARLAQLDSARTGKCSTKSEAAGSAELASGPSGGSTVASGASTKGNELGRDAYNAGKLAAQQACSAQPRPALVGRGPGFESYTVECTSGDTLMIRCEFGNCRALR